MNLRINKLYIFTSLFLLTTLQVFSQNIKLRINAPKEVQIKDNFSIGFIIDSDVEIEDNPKIDDIEGLNVLYGPSVSMSSSTTTGGDGKRKVEYSIVYTYVVVAVKSGKITIPKFEVEQDGKKYESNTATLKVVKSSDELKKNPSKSVDNDEKKKNKIKKIVENAKIDAFIKTIPSKKRVNPSDTLSVTYKLHTTSKDFIVVDANLPSSRMFYSQSYRPKNELERQETIKGVTYYVYDLYKTFLQPRETGSIRMNDGNIKLVYYIKTGLKIKNQMGEEYDAMGEKEMELKIDGISVNVFELTEI